jgi:hypothetical protein
MPGVRIVLHEGQERGLAGVMFDTKIPYGVPTMCKLCRTLHATKVYHINLDSENSTIVSTGVLEQLKKSGAIGTVFDIESEVENPPKLVIQLGQAKPDHNYTNAEVR